MLIDIGLPAIDRDSSNAAGSTCINKDNPANESGTITSIEVYGRAILTKNPIVAIFYLTNGNTLSARSHVHLPNIPPDQKTVFTLDKDSNPIALEVEAGDFIGMYFTPSGSIERSSSGFAGQWYSSGNHTESQNWVYSLWAGDGMSLYGTGGDIPPPLKESARTGIYTFKTLK